MAGSIASSHVIQFTCTCSSIAETCCGVLYRIWQALIHGLGRHYYSMPINYRKNELEQKVFYTLCNYACAYRVACVVYLLTPASQGLGTSVPLHAIYLLVMLSRHCDV